jgi:hypothetical protein
MYVKMCVGLYLTSLVNCDSDFFIFYHHFLIMSSKFLKFERVKNIAENSSKLPMRKHDIVKLRKILFYIM